MYLDPLIYMTTVYQVAMVEIVKLQEKKTNGYSVAVVVVPKRLLSLLGWKRGDYLKVYVEEREGKRVLVYERVE